MRAYLDYNIFTSIEDGQFTIDKIYKIDKSINQLPFSASHIQEVDNINAPSEKRTYYIQKRLQTIKYISQCLYLYHSFEDKEMYLQTEEPEIVLETIRDIPFGKIAMKMFMNFISPTQKEELRKNLGIDTKRLNNYKPIDVIEQLNRSLTSWGTQDSFLQFIEKVIELHPSGSSFGLHNRIAAIYELLDLFGYWKDKETKTSNYARLWDSSHAHFASYCDYFISDDKRNRYKAKVVYQLYNIPTKVISSDGI
jgi:hypothetical protein